jgi:hypothetical protein
MAARHENSGPTTTGAEDFLGTLKAAREGK